MKKIILAILIIGQIFLNAGQSDKELINSPELDDKTNEQMQILAKFVDWNSAYRHIKTTKDLYDILGGFKKIILSKHANFMVSSAVRQDDIKELPSEICMLENLEEIDVEGTGITDRHLA